MVKGPSRNAFYYFTVEVVMPNYGFRSFSEAMPTALEQWKNLSDEERAVWEEKEREWKAYMRGPAGNPYRKDCKGNNLAINVVSGYSAATSDHDLAYDYILTPDDGEVLDQFFYFIAFEYALQDDYGKYYPCEVGLVKYSLHRGIEQYLHYFLQPGEYPTGTKAAAKEHSERRHKIPYIGFQLATSDYLQVFNHIRDVLLSESCGDQPYPPIFCMPEEVDMNRSCLQFLFEKSNLPQSEKIEVVVSASVLVRKLLGESICGEGKAVELLSSTAFDHEKDVACGWHHQREVPYCALATDRKMAYNLTDSLKMPFNLKLTPKHLPTMVPLLAPTDDLEFWGGEGKSFAYGRGASAGSVVSSVDSVVSEQLLAKSIGNVTLAGLGRGRGKVTSTSPYASSQWKTDLADADMNDDFDTFGGGDVSTGDDKEVNFMKFDENCDMDKKSFASSTVKSGKASASSGVRKLSSSLTASSSAMPVLAGFGRGQPVNRP